MISSPVKTAGLISDPPSVQLSAGCGIPIIKTQGRTAPDAEKKLNEARTALSQGRLEDAMQSCREAIRLDPKSALAYFLLGMIELRGGDKHDARDALLQSLALDPAHGATHYYLGRIYISTNELAGAAREFEAAINLGDPSGAAHHALGLTFIAESRVAEAIPHLRTAIERDPNDPERLFTLFGAELQLKRLDDARSDLNRIRARFPQNMALAYRSGKTLLDYDLLADAAAEFDRASALLDQSGGIPPQRDFNSSELYAQIARLRFDGHDYLGALQALAKAPMAEIPVPLRPSTLHLEGQALVGSGRPSEAVAKLRQAAGANPTNPQYLVHLGWAQLQAGQRESAATTLQAAANRFPNVPDVELVASIVKREGGAIRAGVPMSQPWHVKGEGLVCCPCRTPCPCRSNGSTTYKRCENTGMIRIQSGHYGKVALDGVKFVAVNDRMGEQAAPEILYVEPSVTDEQLVALERMMQSFNPLQPTLLVNLERVGISVVYSNQDHTYEVSIPKVLKIRIRRELDKDGRALFLTAALDQFSNTIEYARNLVYKSWDRYGSLNWDYSGRQANFRTIDLDSTSYTDGKMLIQYSDSSGNFTRRQLELIEAQELPQLSSNLQRQASRLQPK
jgi:tetratricopeptide (TPR) repeat protein